MLDWLRKWGYEGVMAALAIATIYFAVQTQTGTTNAIIWVIWGVFVIDYVVRLFRSRRRGSSSCRTYSIYSPSCRST